MVPVSPVPPKTCFACERAVLVIPAPDPLAAAGFGLALDPQHAAFAVLVTAVIADLWREWGRCSSRVHLAIMSLEGASRRTRPLTSDGVRAAYRDRHPVA